MRVEGASALQPLRLPCSGCFLMSETCSASYRYRAAYSKESSDGRKIHSILRRKGQQSARLASERLFLKCLRCVRRSRLNDRRLQSEGIIIVKEATRHFFSARRCLRVSLVPLSLIRHKNKRSCPFLTAHYFVFSPNPLLLFVV